MESREPNSLNFGLASNGEASNSRLAELSNLSSEELQAFKTAFARMAAEGRRRIVSRLVELAEDNVELNFDGIFRICLDDEDPQVRAAGIEGLWENEQTSLIHPLLRLLAEDRSELVRASAASALGRFVLLGEQGKLRSDYTKRVRDALLAVIADGGAGEEVRRRALESVSAFSDSEVRIAISDAYRGSSPRLKISSIYAMGRNCDPAWLPYLLEELKSSDAEARFEAATALGEIADTSAVDQLLEAANDGDSEVRLAVIQALGKVGGPKAKEYLKTCTRSTDRATSEAAQQALEELLICEDPLSPHF